MDMVRSLGLVALAIGVWMWVSHPRTPEAVDAVPWWPAAQAAVAAAGYPVLAPAEGWTWKATSARVEPQPDGTVVWRVGYLTPKGTYAALLQRGVFPEQAGGTAEQWVDEETRDGVEGGTVDIGGREWTRSEGEPQPDERRSLVSESDGTVTVVTGSAAWGELETLAGALRAVG
jgi:hypothetical protein